MKIKLTYLLALSILFTNAQVKIGGNEAPAPDSPLALEVQSQVKPDNTIVPKGFIAPNVSLQSAYDVVTIPNPAEGVMVYNTNKEAPLQKGYYVWKKDAFTKEEYWELVGPAIQKNIVSSKKPGYTLGYIPDGVYNNLANSTITVDGIELTKAGCSSVWNNGIDKIQHYYCAYTANSPITWSQAFKAGREVKGFLFTSTSEEEWEFIKTNVLDTYLSDKNVWMGYTRIKYADESTTKLQTLSYTWITGEESKIVWQGNTFKETENSKRENNFAENHPVLDLTNTDKRACIYIAKSSESPNRQWYDIPCKDTSDPIHKNIDALIIEFEVKPES